ncbi:hypothetical protein [Roseofilum casamattae]|uniref:Phosphorylase n=1 Tax=Roseofilum casamattae BLCC-M143 TaxID=3022442 RepID=A0ABT7C026_9CYAN|nr:hypothetical protein [Roseofilum casamattae]MDJ1184814.1 phosphorylase [Roseofilum casamattae BLCC-M143]
MSNFQVLDVILVPQGAEYRAVRRAVQGLRMSGVRVIPIPIGMEPVTAYLQHWVTEILPDRPRVVVLGLAGSVSPDLSVADIVVYRECVYRHPQQGMLTLECDRSLTERVQAKLGLAREPVRGLTCDRVITETEEKQSLARVAAVVDMEGFAVLQVLQNAGFPVAIARVVSDGFKDSLPPLDGAIDFEGNLQPLPLALTMMKHPARSFKLIRGSLRALSVLSQTTRWLL